MNGSDRGTKSSSPEEETACAWRDADWLVLHAGKAVLPRRCVLCDAPAHGRAKNVVLEPPRSSGLGLFLLSGPLGAVTASFVSQDVSVKLWFCAEHKAKGRSLRRAFWAVLLLGIIIAVLGTICQAAWLDPIHSSDMLAFAPVIAGLVMLAIAAGMALVRPRLIRAKKIDKPFVWLDKVHPDYLARFPELLREEEPEDALGR